MVHPKRGKRNLFLRRRFVIVMDQPALVDALPVFREELPVSTGFHRGVVFLPADNAFHQACLLINQFCRVPFLGHYPIVLRGYRNRCGSGTFCNADAGRDEKE